MSDIAHFGVVIIGAGQAGLQAAMSLEGGGYAAPIAIVGEERYPPYQRPPLSKAFLAGKAKAADLMLQPERYFGDRGIATFFGKKAMSLDRTSRALTLDTGERLSYGHLILATGARVRRFPQGWPQTPILRSIRTLADAEQAKQELDRAKRLVVVGGGYLGLEVASAAAAAGKRVHVLETDEHLLPRSASRFIAHSIERAHRRHATEFRFGARISRICERPDGCDIELESGETLDADAVLVSIGVEPNVDLAARAGLTVKDGIVVDGTLRTDDAHIFAIGDCARFPFRQDGGRPVRVESVQNALDQARHVAEAITGSDVIYEKVPLFWSEQCGIRLQIAGLATNPDNDVIRGDPQSDSFSVYRYRNCELMAVESLNRPADHMLARKLLAGRVHLEPSELSRSDSELKALAQKLLDGGGTSSRAPERRTS